MGFYSIFNLIAYIESCASTAGFSVEFGSQENSAGCEDECSRLFWFSIYFVELVNFFLWKLISFIQITSDTLDAHKHRIFL